MPEMNYVDTTPANLAKVCNSSWQSMDLLAIIKLVSPSGENRICSLPAQILCLPSASLSDKSSFRSTPPQVTVKAPSSKA